MLLWQFLTLLLLYLPVLHQIRLQSDQYLAHALTRIAFYLFNPSPDVLKTLFVIHRISQNDTSCPFIVSLSDIAKSLLSGSVPDLQFNFGFIHVDGLKFKVDTNGRDIAIFENSITKLSQKISLSYSAVSNYYNLSQEVMLAMFCSHFYYY